MIVFWFIRKYMVLIGVVALVYIAADQIAVTSLVISQGTAIDTAKIEQSKAEMQERFAVRYQQLKQAGVFDDSPTVISQASR